MTDAAKKPAEITSINLSQASQGLKKLNLHMNWAFNPHGGKPMDVDFSCFVLGRDGQTRDDEDFIFYNNLQGAALAVKHMGPSGHMGEDGSFSSLSTETLMVDLDNLSFDVWGLMLVISIYQGVENDQTFDVLQKATLIIENADSKEELARLSFSGHKMEKAAAIRVAELRRDGVDWHYSALKEPVEGGLAEIAKGYGILISSTT